MRPLVTRLRAIGVARVSVPLSWRRTLFRLREFASANRDWRRVVARFPTWEQYPALRAETSAALRNVYREYVTRVSSPSMAISSQLAAFLWILLQTLRPRRVLDLGSGFSSYVFRRYASVSTEAMDVWSVDDSDEWLDRTRGFLTERGLPNGNMVGWREFRESGEAGFDVVLHDLGTMDVRAETLEFAMGLVRGGGLVVLDDAHKQPYSSRARSTLARLGIPVFSLRTITLDEIGRYSLLAFA